LAAGSDRQAGTFDSAGVKIAYVTAGKGEPVILIHGLYSSVAINWFLPGTFEMLAGQYRVIALDLRGHGQSDKPEDEAAYGKPMAEDVIRLMDQLKIDKAHVVGYSLGGIIVMRLLVDHPDRFSTATLGGMGYLRQGSTIQGAFDHMNDRAGKTPLAAAHGITQLAVADQEVKAIKVPIQILIGDRDPCKAMYVDPLIKIRPDIPVTEISGAGHLNCIFKPDFKAGILKSLDPKDQGKTALPQDTP